MIVQVQTLVVIWRLERAASGGNLVATVTPSLAATVPQSSRAVPSSEEGRRLRVAMTTNHRRFDVHRSLAPLLLICVALVASCGGSWRDDPTRISICKGRVLLNSEILARYPQERQRMSKLMHDYASDRVSYRDLVVPTKDGLLIPALTPAQAASRIIPDAFDLAILPTGTVLDAVPIASGIRSIRAIDGNAGKPAIEFEFDPSAVSSIANEVDSGERLILVNVWYAVTDFDWSTAASGRFVFHDYPDVKSRDAHLQALCSGSRHKPGWLR